MILVVGAGALLVPAGSSAQGMIFLEVEPLSKECPAGESVVYQWFAFNDFDVSYLLEVFLDNESGVGWSSSFNLKVFVLASQGEAFINLTFSASKDVSSKIVYQTVTFRFTSLNETASSFERSSLIKTELVTVWGLVAPGKNKLLGQFDNPLPEPLDGNYVTFLLNIGIWGAIALFVAYVVDPTVQLFTKRTKTDIDDRILKILRKPVFVLIIVFGLVTSFSILPLSEGEVRLIFQVYGIVLISVLTFIAYKVFKEILIRLGKRLSAKTESEVDDVLIPVIDKIGGVIILIFGAIGIVNYLGYDITFLLAGVGVLGLVIAFAAQDALSNFFSGIFLLLDRPFSEGDYITLSSGEICRVEKIGIRSTRLYEVFENDYIILPNNKLVNDKIINMDEPDEEGKSKVEVGVAYGSDVEKVERIMIEVATAHPNVLNQMGKVPVVRFLKFGDSSLEFGVYVWIDNFMNRWRVAHELRKQLYQRFAEEGIEIPFPQRTVYIKEMPKQGK
jgi:small-conductance mechanosensitive channel